MNSLERLPLARWLCRFTLLSLLLLPGLTTQGQGGNAASKSARDDVSGLQKRAEAGEASAQVDVGLRYLEGTGVSRDLRAAVEWIRKAAMQGDARGQLELGVMYVNGEGVAADLPEAWAWYSLSSQQGNTQAAEYLRDIERSLSSADRDKARRRAAEIAATIQADKAARPRHGQHRSTGVAEKKPANAASSAAPSGAASEKRSQGTGAEAGKQFVEGKDYTIWQRVRIRDENGFGEPVEAYSILLPKDWKTEGAVRWVINTTCPSDTIQNRLTAVSPDGAFRLEIFPQQSWQWYDDPMLLQSAQQAAQFGRSGGCVLAQPYDAGQYMERVFVPIDLKGARLVSHRPNEEMIQVMREEAQRNNAMFQAAGTRLETRPSAHIGRVEWPDGRVGIVLCAVHQLVAAMPNLLNGGVYSSYQCRAAVKTVMMAPAGREAEAESLLGTIMASTRINPQWQAEVSRVFSNMARVNMQETAKRAAIWRQTQNEINEIRQRTWEDTQACRDRMVESWGKVLRGVDTWAEPGGAQVELKSGYSEAWSRGDGTYILSNDPYFDPRAVFQEDWKKLEKKD